ncbi:recQ-mediated genome instability protein 1 [Apophysomyces ossiformis]|uniref:RecQ-mediated genome instability protein 1 n=1 Tax=Apophysomyces ossiformis TaxID=679940 RepID=A0A8H7BUJ1_9FUNG|nr:recQ-mediated genome instability protein 1 [Apophysomyces ossiformis]
MTSHGNTPYNLLRLLEDRSGIRIRPEYLQQWYAERMVSVASNNSDREFLYAALLDDFLNKDMRLTSKPILAEDYGQQPLDTFPAPQFRQTGIVLQIQDTIDISHSAHSLLDSLSTVTTVRHVYTSREDDDEVRFQRGMLRWTLTDGTKEIQALEFKRIPELNMNTPFGCKLLITNCQVRRGVLLLDPSKVKVLGGQVPALYQGNMTAELKRRLQIRLRLPQDAQQRPNNQESPVTHGTRQEQQTAMEVDDEFDELNAADMEELDEIENAMQTVELQANRLAEQITTRAPSPPSVVDLNGFSPLSSAPTRSSASRLTSTSMNNDSLSKAPKPNFRNFAAQYAYQGTQNEPSTSAPIVTPTTPAPSLTIEKPIHQQNAYLSPEEDDSADLDWVGTSVWGALDGEEEPVVKKEVGTQSDENKTFSVARVKEILKAIQNNENIDSVSDQITVEAKARKLSSLKLTPVSGFHLVVHLVDPQTLDSSDEILVVFGNKIITELIGMTHHEVIEMNKTEGKRGITSKVFKPLQHKLKNTHASVELDLTLTEQSSSYSVLMPAVVSYNEFKPS